MASKTTTPHSHSGSTCFPNRRSNNNLGRAAPPSAAELARLWLCPLNIFCQDKVWRGGAGVELGGVYHFSGPHKRMAQYHSVLLDQRIRRRPIMALVFLMVSGHELRLVGTCVITHSPLSHVTTLYIKLQCFVFKAVKGWRCDCHKAGCGTLSTHQKGKIMNRLKKKTMAKIKKRVLQVCLHPA